MRTAKISDFTNGWIIGDFQPTLLKTKEFEIAHHKYPKGFVGTPHTHLIAIEVNYIVKGRLVATGLELTDGDVFIYEPGEYSEVTFLEDTDLIIVKTPSVPGDKY